MSSELAASFAYCRRVARRSGSSFYGSFLLLPRQQRWDMCALYAFLRQVDDLSDGVQSTFDRRAALEACRRSFSEALTGQCDGPLLPALADVVARHGIEPDYLEAVIDGAEMDLDTSRYETAEELEVYCYRVASVVGMACIHIWGFDGADALPLARDCGIALQLTNILRDLKEDLARGRVYLPQEDLRRFGYSDDDLRRRVADVRFNALMHFQIDRAERYYERASELGRWLSPSGRRALGAMMQIYRELLVRIRRDPSQVLRRRTRLSRWRKLRIVTRWWLADVQPATERSGTRAASS